MTLKLDEFPRKAKLLQILGKYFPCIVTVIVESILSLICSCFDTKKPQELGMPKVSLKTPDPGAPPPLSLTFENPRSLTSTIQCLEYQQDTKCYQEQELLNKDVVRQQTNVFHGYYKS